MVQQHYRLRRIRWVGVHVSVRKILRRSLECWHSFRFVFSSISNSIFPWHFLLRPKVKNQFSVVLQVRLALRLQPGFDDINIFHYRASVSVVIIVITTSSSSSRSLPPSDWDRCVTERTTRNQRCYVTRRENSCAMPCTASATHCYDNVTTKSICIPISHSLFVLSNTSLTMLETYGQRSWITNSCWCRMEVELAEIFREVYEK